MGLLLQGKIREHMRRQCRWGALYGECTSGNPQEKTFRISLRKHLGLALRFLCHFRTGFFVCFKQFPPLFLSGCFFLFLVVNPLKQLGIFNSNN